MGAPDAIEITESTVTVIPTPDIADGALELVDDVAEAGSSLFRKILKIILIIIIINVVVNVVKMLLEKNAAPSDEQPTFETKPVDTTPPEPVADEADEGAEAEETEEEAAAEDEDAGEA